MRRKPAVSIIGKYDYMGRDEDQAHRQTMFLLKLRCTVCGHTGKVVAVRDKLKRVKCGECTDKVWNIRIKGVEQKITIYPSTLSPERHTELGIAELEKLKKKGVITSGTLPR